MLESIKTAAICSSGCIALIGFVYVAVKESLRIHKKNHTKRLEKKLAKDELKRIEKEKEYAYSVYLKYKKDIEEVIKK